MEITVEKEYFNSLSNYLKSPGKISALKGSNSIPDYLSTWFGKLKLLKNIPFNYLVPDEKMLPLESIRFFYLDLNWIYALIDGAFSLGRVLESDIAVDSTLTASLQAQAIQKTRIFRDNTRPAGEPNFETVTGFILRSEVVKGWPDLEVNAYNADNPDDPKTSHNNPLTTLRFEKITENIMIGLFEGTFNLLEIHEPPEGLHFGLDIDDKIPPDKNPQDPANYEKQLKFLKANDQGRAGDPIPTQLAFINNIPYRDNVSRVIRMGQLAGDIKNQLEQARLSDGSFKSGEFAFQMVEGVGLVKFKKI